MKLFSKTTLSVAAVAAAVSFAAPSSAAVIFGLYNTGVDNAGKVIAPGLSEQHYVITATNVALNHNSNVPLHAVNLTPFTTFNNPTWAANSAVGSNGSGWITQGLSATGNNRPGKSGPNKPAGTTPADANRYDYTLTFNLGGLSASSAQLGGKLASDNFARVLLNGVDIGGQTPVNAPGVLSNFKAFSAFGTASGFQSGINTLTFQVYDYGAVSGLRVADLAGTAVPEPATWAMMLVGFGGVASMARRRRSRGASVLA